MPPKKIRSGAYLNESKCNQETRYLPVKNKFQVMWQIKKWEVLNQTTVVAFSTIPGSFWGEPFIRLASLASTSSSYAAAWTPRAARPDGSGFFDHAASHSTAFAVLHATLGPPGTVDLAAFCSEMANWK